MYVNERRGYIVAFIASGRGKYCLAVNMGRKNIVYSCWLIKPQRSPFCNYYQGTIQSTWFLCAPSVLHGCRDRHSKWIWTHSQIRLRPPSDWLIMPTNDVLGCCPNQPSIRSPCKQNCITRTKVQEMWMAPHILIGEIWLSGL
jgi:hypothetical protein